MNVSMTEFSIPNILIVDDHQENLHILRIMLKRANYHVQEAHSGMMALEMITGDPPDLILLDIMMPGLDGFEVCERLKADEATASIPVIFLSARNEVEDRLRAFETGGVDYVSKPFNATELVARIETHLNLVWQRHEIERMHQRDQELIIELERQVKQRIESENELMMLHKKLNSHNARLNNLVGERTQQLDRMNQRMAAILASVQDAIVLLSHDGTISNTNEGFNRLFGYLPDELYDHPIETIVASADVESMRAVFEQARTQQTSATLQVEAICKSGRKMDIEMAFSRIKLDDEHLVCTCHDITHLKEAQRIKDNFISMVTHELRTPIASVMLIAGLLNRHFDRLTEEQHRTKLNDVYNQAKVLSEVVESVLDISRLDTRQKTHTEVFDLNLVMKDVAEEMSATASQKQQTLSVHQPEDSQTILGDPVDFKRIWRNLISNAIKYTKQDGQIEVRVGSLWIDEYGEWDASHTLLTPDGLNWNQLPPDTYVVGQVVDNGHGISDEDKANLFTRFNRGWAKQSNIPGTGLGLSLVKELINTYGGDIIVDSELNQGSMFTFWLPAKKDKENLHDSRFDR